MEIGSVIVVVMMAVGFAFAALFIAKNGGWQGEQCQGHCATCEHKCADQLEQRKADAKTAVAQAKATATEDATE